MKTLRKTLFIAALFLTAVACGKKESPAPQNSENNNPVPVIDNCGTDNPVEKLAWIGELRLKTYPQPRMYAYIHENKTIFAFSECADCDDERMIIFNCKGETLAVGKTKCNEILQKANSQKLLFEGNLPVCGTDNPVEKLAWIGELRLKNYPQPRMYSCLYENEIVFAFTETGTFNDDNSKIFNCKGETLAVGKTKCNEILEHSQHRKLLFDGNLTDCDRVENPATEVSFLAMAIKESEAQAAVSGKSDLIIYSCLYRGRRIYGVAFMANGKYAPDYIETFWDCKSNCLAHSYPTRPDDTFEKMFRECTNFELIYIYKP